MPIIGIMASQISGHLWAPSGAYDSIATATVGAGGSSSITFSSIPSTYTHLQIRYTARTNRADVQDLIRFRFNSDSGTNYAYHWMRGDTATADAGNGTSTASPWTGLTAGANAAANVFAGGVTDVLDYTSTNKNKTVRNISGIDTNSADGRWMMFSNLWFATPATITSIEIAPNYGTSFSQYSSFALYGIKGGN